MLNELAFASRNKHERHFLPQLRVLQPSNSILEISAALKKRRKNQGKKKAPFQSYFRRNQSVKNSVSYQNELAFVSRNKHERHFHPQLHVLRPSNSILEINVALKNEGKIKKKQRLIFNHILMGPNFVDSVEV